MTKYLPRQLKNLTPIQLKAYNDWKHRFIIFCAGRRSRKTLIFKRKVMIHALLNSNRNYFHAAPTIAQAKRIFWEDLKEDYRLALKYSPNETDKVLFLKNGSKIFLFGLEKAERIEGVLAWHGGHITEYADIKEKVYKENLRPAVADTKGFLYRDGVPGGRNHYYDASLKACGGALPEVILPQTGAYGENGDSAFYAWLSGDVLDEAEMQSIAEDTDDRTMEQEYYAKFLALEGVAYYNFNKKNIVPCKYNPKLPVLIGMDFNIDPMTGVFLHDINGILHQFGEAHLPKSNTYEMVDFIDDYFKIDKLDPKLKKEKFIIHPDSTGKAERSNASESDIAILKKAHFGIKAKSSNPRQKDRVNAVNSKIKSKSGKISYFVDPSCKKTIKDLNKREQLKDGRLDKNQEKSEGIGHISDALGYLISYRYPLKHRGGVELV